jgi:hypothetical protein
MKKMKIVTGILFYLLGSYVFGQENLEKEKVSLGVSCGFNLSQWGNDAKKFADDICNELSNEGMFLKLDNKPRFGINFSIYADFPINHFLSLQPELLYQNKGTVLKGNGNYQGIRMDIRYAMITNYLSFPLLLNLHGIRQEYSEYAYFIAGPSLNFNMHSAMKLTISALDETDSEKENYDGFKSMDFGWVLGLGYDFYDARIELRFEKGLTNSVKPDYDSYVFKNNTVSFNASIPLR